MDVLWRDRWRLLAPSKQSYVPFYEMAVIYAGLGENDQALASLQMACNERAGTFVFPKLDPRFDSLRSDSRYQDFLRCVGLPP